QRRGPVRAELDHQVDPPGAARTGAGAGCDAVLAYQIANKPIRTKKATGREVFKDRFDPSKKKRKNTEIDGGNRITLKSSSRNPQWQRTWHKRLGWDA
ncbi:hypothetical protein ABZ749_12470, partial [Micromonospora sp. NPDC047753]|uniref:hypothetical protein n=1 Tax=Micromonospora sp. NPDC047753 TaxID=3154817 RepID=UPI0033E49FB6